MAAPTRSSLDVEDGTPGTYKVPTLIDNTATNKLLKALKQLSSESHRLDVATCFFELGSLLDLDGDWQKLDKIRILMGADSRKPRMMILKENIEGPQNGIERVQEEDDWRALDGLKAIRAAIDSKAIEAKVYTKLKFHAKAFYFHTNGSTDRGVIGSSNFTHKGLTENLELNLFTSSKNDLDPIKEWYQQMWDEAEDLTPDLNRVIQPYIREYTPFEIYLKAMRERFFGLEADDSGWEQSESLVFPHLAKYQRDAYFDLMHMAKTWDGAMLCDGVGLGKTYVGLMLIERALKDKHRVLVIAPKATIPSVWNKNLLKFFPDDFHSDPEYQHDIKVIPHTDLGRHGGITPEKLEKLRQRYETIIIDEAHHFRVPNRNRSKNLKILTKDRRVFMLTATPVNNSLLDLYNLLNFISQDRPKHFERIGIPRLRDWFSKMMGERDQSQPELDFFEVPEFEAFLKNIIVQRSRRYVKSLEKQEDEAVVFPIREKPVVIKYSLERVYGAVLPELLQAFDKHKAKLKLVIYETEKFKEASKQDDSVLQEQSQVVGLIRTMLLKRLESSQKALEASIEDLLLKHITLLKDLEQSPIKYEVWLAENRELFDTLQRHRQERLGTDDEDEEEDNLPLTTYEAKKIAAVKADMLLFGTKQDEWIDGLEKDTLVLTTLLRGLHEVTRPDNDDKLQALINQIATTPRLQNDKFVLFSEFKDTARYLEQQLKRQLPNDTIVEVDSGRNVKNREDVIKRFAPHYNCETPEECAKALKDPIRILISTDVLAEGLNLQDANIIINYDLHWNPVRLMQRIGRVDRRMDPAKPVKYDKVHVFNFLPPDELEQVLGLYRTITGKLVAINRALGIEAPVLSAEDDFKALDFYQNMGQSSMSVVEQLRLKAHKLAQDYPEQWEAAHDFPNRIYSGKGSPSPSGGEGLFFTYRIPTGYQKDVPDPQPTYDSKWFLMDRTTGVITEDLAQIHEAIVSTPETPRQETTEPKDRTRLRKKLEDKVIAEAIFKAQLPVALKSQLVCWMETA